MKQEFIIKIVIKIVVPMKLRVSYSKLSTHRSMVVLFLRINIRKIASSCDAPKPGGPLTTRQPVEYKWMSGYPTPFQKIGQSLLCTGSSTLST